MKPEEAKQKEDQKGKEMLDQIKNIELRHKNKEKEKKNNNKLGGGVQPLGIS